MIGRPAAEGEEDKHGLGTRLSAEGLIPSAYCKRVPLTRARYSRTNAGSGRDTYASEPDPPPPVGARSLTSAAPGRRARRSAQTRTTVASAPQHSTTLSPPPFVLVCVFCVFSRLTGLTRTIAKPPTCSALYTTAGQLSHPAKNRAHHSHVYHGYTWTPRPHRWTSPVDTCNPTAAYKGL